MDGKNCFGVFGLASALRVPAIFSSSVSVWRGTWIGVSVKQVSVKRFVQGSLIPRIRIWLRKCRAQR